MQTDPQRIEMPLCLQAEMILSSSLTHHCGQQQLIWMLQAECGTEPNALGLGGTSGRMV